MDTLCADIGNFSVLTAVVGNKPASINKMRSLIVDVTHKGDVRDGLTADDSPLVEVKGKFFKLGRQAGRQPNCLSAAEAGKNQAEIFLPMLLANTPDGFEGSVSMLVPAFSKSAETWIRTAVLGTHEYSVNKAERIASFTDIEFHRESDTALHYAYIRGIVPPHEGTLLIDIGGGTVNAVIATFEDGELDILWRDSFDNRGGIALAKGILDTDYVKAQKTMKTADIMDAIANGKRYIGNRPDRSFEPVFDDCVKAWFKAIRVTVMSAADAYLDDVNNIVWMGGSVELLRPQLEGKDGQLVFPSPQEANINALIHFCGGDVEVVAA
ncbi:MAG: hypothetical protein HC836_15975 [Richelia sp. RM2_1_2]|nr:hypothetical protein [Richelia sp. SM2_1_7]NJM22046.1 hypothetical protein [Richelia sp. SM1_7_0]NJN11073.1 hypothetical protein [Richelia sp. RM1_1_1]NJO59742.1 hypothetical protein [Richelia sp. RM2_1_2]